MPDIKTAPTISIVVPFHNEEPNVIELYGRLQGVMEELGRSYQFVFVDDGSRDLTYKLLKELAEIDPHVSRGSAASKLRPDRSARCWVRAQHWRICDRHGWRSSA